jgi:hypothetical protein
MVDILKLFTTNLEVLDPNTGTVVTRGELTGYVVGTMPGGRVATYHRRQDGSSYVSIRRLALRRSD